MSAPPRPGARIVPWPGPRRPADAPPADATANAESAERARRRRRLWLRETQVIAASYALNGAFLACFALTGTVHWSAALLYAGPGWLCSAVAAWLIASGRSAAWPDPAVSNPQSAFGMGLAVVGLASFPEVAFLYVLILFTIFLSATYRMSRLHANLAWGLVSVAIGAAVLTNGRTLQIPHATPAESLLAYAAFVATLGRCVLLSLINSGHNQLLRRRGQQMAETLARIEHLAHWDELTGVPNRRSVLRHLDDEMARAAREGGPLSVALIDIDHFKAVNDARGHLVGDRTLQTFAGVMQAHGRATDGFGRYGGEEFLLVMPGTGADDAAGAMARLRDKVARADWDAVAPGLSITFSAGVATRRDGETAEQLLGRADRGLYGAKDAGRDCHRAG